MCGSPSRFSLSYTLYLPEKSFSVAEVFGYTKLVSSQKDKMCDCLCDHARQSIRFLDLPVLDLIIIACFPPSSLTSCEEFLVTQSLSVPKRDKMSDCSVLNWTWLFTIPNSVFCPTCKGQKWLKLSTVKISTVFTFFKLLFDCPFSW